MKSRKELIQNTITDMISNFLFYDRKEDEYLPRGEIEDAIKNGEITVEEIVSQFENSLREALK